MILASAATAAALVAAALFLIGPGVPVWLWCELQAAPPDPYDDQR